MSIRNLVSTTTSSVSNGILAVADAGSLLTDWVSSEKEIRNATKELNIERRITDAFIDHAKWKKDLSSKYDNEVLVEARAMMEKKGIEF